MVMLTQTMIIAFFSMTISLCVVNAADIQGAKAEADRAYGEYYKELRKKGGKVTPDQAAALKKQIVDPANGKVTKALADHQSEVVKQITDFNKKSIEKNKKKLTSAPGTAPVKESAKGAVSEGYQSRKPEQAPPKNVDFSTSEPPVDRPLDGSHIEKVIEFPAKAPKK